MAREKKNRRASPPPARVESNPWLELRLTACVWNEALAFITSGIAHDTNNCLTGILSMSDACLAQIDSGHPLHESMDLVKQSAHKATLLIQQLMRVHHEKTGQRTYEDLNLIVTDTAELLKRVLRRRIDLRVQLEGMPLPVWMDAVELRRTIILLVLNAAQAMETKGTLTLGTSTHVSIPSKCDLYGRSPRAPVVCLMIAADAPTLEVLQVASLFGPLADIGPNTAEIAWRLRLAKQFAEKYEGALTVEASHGRRVVSLWLPQSDLTEAEK